MPYYRERQPWVVTIGWRRYTPQDPGPLSGAWAFAYGPLGECRHGELGLSRDPGILLDNELVQVWETPDTSRPPDFLGVAGVVRGNDSLSAGAYTLAVVGLGDIDAAGLARYSEYANSGAGYGQEGPGPEETTEAYCNRILEPFADGGWGVRGDGARVVGVPQGGVSIGVGEVHGYTSSGYQRREYVTETSCSPGDRWRRLYDTRGTPLPYAPRVYQAASSDNLILADVTRQPEVVSSGEGTAGLEKGQSLSVAPQAYDPLSLAYSDAGGEAYLTIGQPPSDGIYGPVVLRLRTSLPLSELVRRSARSKLATDATYELKSLRLGLVASGISRPLQGLPAQAEGFIQEQPVTVFPRPGTLKWRVSLCSSPGGTWDNALSREFTGQYVLPSGGESAQVPVDVPEDLIAEVYQSINGGSYWLVVEAELTVETVIKLWYHDAEGGERIYTVQNGSRQASLGLTAPVMTVDAMVDRIPPENYPPGWDAPSVSPPTSQGRVPGALIPPASVSGPGQYVTEARVVRETTQMYTEIQTGARQTQRLLRSEKRLKTAVDNSQGRGGAW